ncbi:short-chain dehydrogenase/reductase SDR [Segniliparus rotundus DSM 44985]|uniref:Short-chain dehydrogenase/reductase SDR n=1 Tax=Segniliparus rotundus (strain ATCC BAA-972 / CDC 1076 / CIP 108378 / DSM 44985 / JCM 13578) TaxID=640132 RepID=D6ZAG0_SEGRD|nr:SDR family oxidoreductase [Segniliparus rotundus]ADG96702.1 short-chain dehydrogenase/reductase SDR [Segniliparus rotundus DSM 44985]
MSNIAVRNHPSRVLAKVDDAANRFVLRAAPDWKLSRARRDPSYGTAIRGKRVLITGASSGIGEAAAHRFAELGATVLLVARRHDELAAVAAKIHAAGGHAAVFACDLRDLDAVDALAEKVNAEHGGVDVLVNNAGHSIRRDTAESLERWHDIERTMQINYFSAMRLVRDFLPGMLERRDGHIINISSWVVPIEAGTRFVGYGAAKAAASIAARSIQLEYGHRGVCGSSVHFPLVRTPMIAPTEEYDNLAALSAQEAAEWLVLAARTRVSRVLPRVSYFLQAVEVLAPRLARQMIVAGGRGR